ncbi:receptor-like protein 9DC3 [Corylus avellana]|uniref:receptor-like protein 9DC3 n=1 Tax=Corylus avellana TaxID=13451 RepID=UPI002869F81F|nr:receptor-like protein 9DC3 [Corylus avellana]
MDSYLYRFKFVRFLFLLSILFLVLLTASLSSLQPFCHDDERSALLQFKDSFIIKKSASLDPFGYPKGVASWTLEGANSDCCSWDGVDCNGDTGHVIGLDLSSSFLYGSFNSSNSLFGLLQLQRLNLANNDFNGSQIPYGVGNLLRLTYLNLSDSVFSGQIPSKLSHLTKLTFLDLSWNILIGHIPSSFFANLTQLRYLYLSHNKLSGTLEFDMFLKIKSLSVLDLSSNNLTLLTKANSNDTLPQFHTLGLGSCNLQKFPDFLRSQNKLSWLDLGDNNLEGLVPRWMYNASRESLVRISLSNNFLKGFEQSPVVLPWSNLASLYLDNNMLQGSLPIPQPSINTYRVQRNLIREMSPLICNLSSLYELDLSYNKLSGKLHPCLGNFSSHLSVLNLRSNNFCGTIPKTWEKGSKLTVIDLSENQLQGQLPRSMANSMMLEYLNVSSNQINDIFPFWLVCNLRSLELLDLSYNNLSGKFHPCLGNVNSTLSILILRGNNFQGTIPKIWAVGNNLTVIDLSENQFQGELPRSMANCLMHEFLHVGNNQINDTFPFWLGTLSRLKVIVLRSNAFRGAIKGLEINNTFPELHILDLSQNSFSGILPTEYFQHWNAMKVVGGNKLNYMEVNSTGDGLGSSGQCTITITNKGTKLSYEKIPDVFRVIDFSSNRFEGEIPEVVGSLKGLHSLNLSNNALTGHIPASLGNLTNLESMDLSRNKLFGEIPSQLTQLFSLAYFNVSNNCLTGPIPRGNQLDTFQNNSFGGNTGLCGSPLSKKCGDFNYTLTPPYPFEENQSSESSFEFGWKVVVIGYGCGFVIGVVIGQIVITRKYGWFVKIFGKM